MKTLALLAAIATLSTTTLLILSLLHKDPAAEVSFTRTSGTIVPTHRTTFTLPYNSFGFVTLLQDSLWLDNRTAGRLLTAFNTRHQQLKDYAIEIQPPNQGFISPSIALDANNIYFVDGSVPIIMRGPRHNQTVLPFLNPPRFHDCTYIGNGAFALKIHDTTNNQDQLAFINARGDTTTMRLLQKQIDGIFCVDGILLYNAFLNSIIYVYYYRNEFIVADTTGRNVTHAHTIDNVTTAHIRVGSWQQANTRVKTLSQPPLKVNARAVTSRNFLFIVSSLTADNDTPEKMNATFPVDVYTLPGGNYVSSFYLPSPYPRRNLVNTDFLVEGDTLFAIFNDRLSTFTLHGLSPD